MKRKFTILVGALLALSISASAQLAATLNWAHSVQGQTTSGNSPISINKLADGNYIVFSEWGSKSDAGAEYLHFDNAATSFKGGEYTGNSYCANALIQKTSPADGSVLWTVYSNYGYINSGCSHVSPTADGGFVATFEARALVPAKDFNNKKLLSVVQADGNNYDIAFDTELYVGSSNTEAANVILKFDANGSIEWSRVLRSKVLTDRTNSPSLTNTSLNTLATDEDGNIYIAGNYRSELYIPKADNTTETLVCGNTAEWSGDAQTATGELFIVKLNKNGFFEKSLLTSGKSELSYIDNITYASGKIYFSGHAKKTTDTDVLSLDGKTINASASLQTMFYGAASTADMTVDYIKTLASIANSKGSFVIQNKNLKFADGKLYFTGSVNGGFAEDGKSEAFTSNNGTLLKGFVLKADATTGDIEASYCFADSKSVSAYYGTWIGDKIVATGYDMNAAVGHVFTVLNKETLAKEETISVCNAFGSVAMIATPLQDGNTFVVGNRGKGETATILNGSETSPLAVGSKSYWGVVYMSYALDFGTTGIEKTAVADTESAKAYNIAGQRVNPASKGITIINGRKYLNK
ncbi:MAG: hypothetical protein K5757_09510 [Bacteroidaceae bacterium]|nr:hypothetical protein [Bacteroidaceae bacterium]